MNQIQSPSKEIFSQVDFQMARNTLSKKIASIDGISDFMVQQQLKYYIKCKFSPHFNESAAESSRRYLPKKFSPLDSKIQDYLSEIPHISDEDIRAISDAKKPFTWPFPPERYYNPTPRTPWYIDCPVLNGFEKEYLFHADILCIRRWAQEWVHTTLS